MQHTLVQNLGFGLNSRPALDLWRVALTSLTLSFLLCKADWVIAPAAGLWEEPLGTCVEGVALCRIHSGFQTLAVVTREGRCCGPVHVTVPGAVLCTDDIINLCGKQFWARRW